MLSFQDSNSDGKVDLKGIGSLIHYFQGTTHNDRRFRGMPYFSFDLVIGQEFEDQGGMILEDLTTAADRADQLAVELCIVRPELRSRGYAIRVTDDGEKEVYRTPLEAMSSGHARSHSDRLPGIRMFAASLASSRGGCLPSHFAQANQNYMTLAEERCWERMR